MKNEKNDLIKTKNKLAWLLIAIGLIAGGIVGLTRDPPPEPVGGWTITTHDYTIPITDQNDDNVEDLLVWSNPIDFDNCEDCGERDKRDMTAQIEILSGKDGTVIESKLYENEDPWCLDYNGLFKGTVSESGYFIFIGYYLRNGDPEYLDLYDDRYDLKKTSLIQISLESLELKSTNIFEMEWESFEPINNTGGYMGYVDPDVEESLQSYRPRVDYLGDWSIFTPGTSYEGDVIVFRNQFWFKNSTGDYVNNRKLSFINPTTMETLSTIIWDREKDPALNNSYYDLNFCEGPTFSYQIEWKMPYLYSISYVDRGVPGIHDLVLSTAKISDLRNDTASINWKVYNLTFSRIDVTNEPIREIKVILSTNSTKDVVSLSTLHTEWRDLSNPLSEDDIENNLDLFDGDKDLLLPYFWEFAEKDSKIPYISASRLNVYNIQNQPNKTFNFESYLGETLDETANSLNISQDEKDSNLGIINDIIPIKIDDTKGLGNTSIALICTSGTYSVQEIDGFRYPVLRYNVFHLEGDQVGLTIPNEPYNGVDNEGTSGKMFSRLLNFDLYNLDVRFDIDNDDVTDIGIPGLYISKDIESILKDVEKQPINGPFAVFTNREVIQEQFYSLDYFNNIQFLSDLNEDNLPDVLIQYYAIAFTSTEFDPKDRFTLIMEDPTTSTLFILGIFCIILGALLIAILFLKMKGSPFTFKSQNNKRQLIMLIISILLVVALYVSLAEILDRDEGGTIIGQTAFSRSLQDISNTSNIASFIFVLMLPATAGIFMLLSPIAADGIVGLNQVRFAKKAGLEAAIKKEEMKDVKEQAHINYKVLFIPPFGRKSRSLTIIGRVLAILALGLSIGLTVFDYYFTYSSEALPATVSSIEDPNFGIYCSALFSFLIVPGILAIPLFFWLLPSSWLLDDAGVVFYAKRLNSRKPEDIERIGGWFSSYLKGFLGISAILSYIRFIIESPITKSSGIAESGMAFSVYFFVFGFPIVTGLSIGLLALVMHEYSLPHNANVLYKRLSNRKVASNISEISFKIKEEITDEKVLKGFTQYPPAKNENNSESR